MAPSSFARVRTALRTGVWCAALGLGSGSASAQSSINAQASASAPSSINGQASTTTQSPANAPAGDVGDAAELPVSESQRELETAFWQGEDLFEQGSYAAAAAAFTKALELSQHADVSETWRKFSPSIAFNIASSYRHAGNCEGARMAYAHYAGLVHEVPAEHLAWHDAFVQECPAPAVATAKSAEVPSPAAASAPTASGQWLLDVNAPPRAPVQDSSAMDTGRILGWSAAGVGVVALGAAGVVWVSASHFDEQADGKRLWADAQEYSNAANARRIVAGVLAGAGVVLGGVSVYLLTQPEPAVTTATPISPGLASLAVHSNGTNIAVIGQF